MAFQNFYQGHNVGMTHELNYKMNEFIVNFPEILGFKRLCRLEARVFRLSVWSLRLQGFQDFSKLMVLSLHWSKPIWEVK